jgi:hypothetical protein
MVQHPVTARRLRAIVISAALAVTGVACSSDDGDSSLPADKTTVPAGTSTTGNSSGTTSGDPGSDDPFADVSDAEVDAYCDAVQAARPLTVEKAQVIAESSAAPIKAEIERLAAGQASGADQATQDAGLEALANLARLQQEVCGIPIDFG